MKKTITLGLSLLLLAASCNQSGLTGVNGNQQDQGQQATSTDKGIQPLPQGDKEGWNSYASPSKYGFEIKYPGDFRLNVKYDQVKLLSYIPVCDESMIACLFYSKDNQRGTNLEGAGISMNVLEDSGTETVCLAPRQAEEQIGEQDINGAVYRVYKGGQGAAGHFEEYRKYRVFKNSRCYEVALRTGSTSIGVYEPGTVREFNKNEVWNRMEQVLSTFKLVDASAAKAGSSVSIIGRITCLPHRDAKPGQPQTLECAIGLQEQGTGKYYGLKNNRGPFYDTDSWVRVTGVLEEDPQGKYEVAGNIQVSEIARAEKE